MIPGFWDRDPLPQAYPSARSTPSWYLLTLNRVRALSPQRPKGVSAAECHLWQSCEGTAALPKL